MGWLWIVGAAWVLLSVGLALVIGRSIGLADRKAADLAPDAPNFVVDRPPLAVVPRTTEGSIADVPPPDGQPPGAPLATDAGEMPTTPGIPVARPEVGSPPVPRVPRRLPHRRTG